MRYLIVLLLGLCAASAFAGLPRDSRVPGGVAVVPLGSSGLPRPHVRFRDSPVLVVARAGQWLALVGLALDLEPGSQEILVGERRLKFSVRNKRYPEQRLIVRDHGQVELSPENAVRVEREHQEIRRLKNVHREVVDVDSDFALPAAGPRSGRFGARRVFNGQPRAPHVGLDIAIDRGQPVHGVAAGRVLAVGDYFFNGKTVFVDHGGGLISMLCHLDSIEVRPGDELIRGQSVGISGMTGRATGPHVHWSVILNGAMVDPELFLPAAGGRSKR